MRTKFTSYTTDESKERIKEILDQEDGVFEEVDTIPSADTLTYANGFYVNCTAVFVDIRGSSQLPDKHTRPVLAKIYRSYISECVALFNSWPKCKEVFINGDCVSAIFDTPYKPDIDDAFSAAAQINSLIYVLNWLYEGKGYSTIQCGIGMSYGRALMLKAGYKGSGINDIVWMGDVVNDASNLCHLGNKNGRKALQLSTGVYQNLKEENQNMLNPVREIDLIWSDITHYEGDIVNTAMEKWLEEQKNEQARKAELLRSALRGTPGFSLSDILNPRK